MNKFNICDQCEWVSLCLKNQCCVPITTLDDLCYFTLVNNDTLPAGWRFRHSLNEKWYYSDMPFYWWESEPFYIKTEFLNIKDKILSKLSRLTKGLSDESLDLNNLMIVKVGRLDG